MKKTLLFVVVCILAVGLSGAWAAIPSHTGANDPLSEGWNPDRTYLTGGGTAYAGSDGSWVTSSPVTNAQAYYCAAFTPEELPANWQMEVTVKAVLATSEEGVFFALGDGAKIWELQVLTTSGSGGLYNKKIGGWTQLAAFESDQQFHTYKVVKFAADSFASVYMDGTAVGQMLQAEMYPYTSRSELQMGGGAWSQPSEAHWAAFSVTEAPVPEPSSLLGLATGLTGLAGFIIRRKM